MQKRPPPRKSPHPVRLGHPSVFHVCWWRLSCRSSCSCCAHAAACVRQRSAGQRGQYPARRSGSTRNLDSAGGQVEEGDRVLAVLNEIKLLHQLITVVPHGKLCASMCIPISLQGEDRLATRASLWIFNEAAQRQANGQQRTDIAETRRWSANATEDGFMAEAGREWRQ